VPLKVLVDKFINVRYEPSGITANPDIRFAKSITDYVFRWVALKFLPDHPVAAEHRRQGAERDAAAAAGGNGKPASAGVTPDPAAVRPGGEPAHETMTDAPTCPDCGALMERNAACYRCFNCGTSNGCS